MDIEKLKKEKEDLLKEKEDLLKQREILMGDKDTFFRLLTNQQFEVYNRIGDEIKEKDRAILETNKFIAQASLSSNGKTMNI